MSGVLWFQLALTLCVAPLHGTWREALLCGFGIVVPTQFLLLLRTGHRATRVIAAIAFMCLSALLINQMHGMIEMHFSVFVLLAFLLFYSDWLPVAVGAAVIAIHHLAFHFLQTGGYPVWVFPHVCDLSIVIIHAAFVVFETLLLVFMAIQHEKTAVETGEVISMLQAVLTTDRIDLRVTSNLNTGSAPHFSKLIGLLRELVGQVIRHSETIVGSSERIAVSASEVSTASDLQKQEIRQAAIAMQELRSAIAEISRNSHEVAAKMMDSREQAIEGGKVVTDTIATIQDVSMATRDTASTIEELGRASQSIGKIADTINEIAGRTNLLALNASIEAARAGEHGRGFAVVAGEVRGLAERTGNATREIGEMILEIQQGSAKAAESMRIGMEKVNASVQAAEKAGDVLERIIGAAEAQNSLISMIATSTTQQAATTEQVNGNMDEIMRMVERSVTSAGRSADESGGLNGLAVELRGLLHRFSV